MLHLDDTIVAIASAAGPGARGILRLSGPDAAAYLEELFLGPGALDTEVSRLTVIDGVVRPAADLPPVPATLYRWPVGRSYTGQAVAELHTLSAPVLLEQCVRAVLVRGARLARPGEFTLRAFLTGRIDLVEAEAVLGVIDAEGAAGLTVALEQLAGGLSTPLGRLRDELVDLAADLEAGLDFSHEDIALVSADELLLRLTAARAEVQGLVRRLTLRTPGSGLPRVVIVGEPNAGKSCLLNALVGSPTAIVSPQEGTTRDYVTAECDLVGGKCLLVDTAGAEMPAAGAPLPGTASPTHADKAAPPSVTAAAQAAMRRQRDQAALTLLCLDASQRSTAWERGELACEDRRRIVVVTKADLVPTATEQRGLPPGAVVTSTATGEGIDRLRARVAERLWAEESAVGEAVPATAVRCHDALRRAGEALARARDLAEAAAGEELVADEVRGAVGGLDEVLGTVYTEDLLDRVFSRFCIGK